MMKILYYAKNEEWGIYKTLLNTALKQEGFSDFEILNNHRIEKADIDFIIYAPKDQNFDFSKFINFEKSKF